MDIKKICRDLNFTSLYWTNQYIQKVCRKLELNWTELNWTELNGKIYQKKVAAYIYVCISVYICQK